MTHCEVSEALVGERQANCTRSRVAEHEGLEGSSGAGRG